MVRKKCLVFGMALALLLTSNPMVSEAEEPGEEAQASAEIGTEAEEDAYAEEWEALEAEARWQMAEESERQMLEAVAAEREEEAKQQKEAETAAKAERQMAEAISPGEPEAGSAETQTAGISWRVDGDTVVISGEGYVQYEDSLHDVMAAAKHVRFEGCKILGGMHGFFYQLKNLKSIDLKGLDTSQVTDMGGMFGFCSGLMVLDVSGFDTSQVTDMGGCSEAAAD